MISNPFIKTTKDNTSKYTIVSLFGLPQRKRTDGQVGLEVEVEGNQFPKTDQEYDEDEEPCDDSRFIPYQWRYTHDGSLRGFDNAEYVLTKPLNFNEINEAVDDLWKMFDEYGSVLDESNRTSVHVHVNAQNFRLNRLCAFASLWFVVEEVLTQWCGDHRAGNLFCLRAKDAKAIVSKLRKFLVLGDYRIIANDDGLHYAGFNTQALAKFGSIEIRHLRGATDPEVIKTWVGIIRRIYELSEQYQDDPRLVCEGFSGQPCEDFLRNILGQYTDKIVAECGMTGYQIRKSIHEGVRIAQTLSHCRNWQEYKAETVTPDPFGRSYNAIKQAQEVAEPVVATASTLDEFITYDYQVSVNTSPPPSWSIYEDFATIFSPSTTASENSDDYI